MTRGLWWVYPVLLAAWVFGLFAVARARDRRSVEARSGLQRSVEGRHGRSALLHRSPGRPPSPRARGARRSDFAGPPMRRVRPDQVRSQHVAARTGQARQDVGLSFARAGCMQEFTRGQPEEMRYGLVFAGVLDPGWRGDGGDGHDVSAPIHPAINQRRQRTTICPRGGQILPDQDGALCCFGTLPSSGHRNCRAATAASGQRGAGRRHDVAPRALSDPLPVETAPGAAE